ncbi:capsular polysaccharide synthesis protein [Nesterenkonia alba]|uniref:capsular polysaccharide synthesis protein n=1 Tax=Nesterenkonia alba TaxID=515814 RepID=UPI000A02AC59
MEDGLAMRGLAKAAQARKRATQLMYYALDFSPRYALLQMRCTIDSQRAIRNGWVGFTREVHARKDIWVQHFLRREFSDLIDDWKKREESDPNLPLNWSQTAPIWILWLQGKHAIPPHVAAKVRTVRQHAGRHPVQVVDRADLRHLVNIPDDIYKKYDSGIISHAFFSDIARIWLLTQHGGLWLDSSVVLVSEIPEEVWLSPYWTAKEIDPRFPLEPVCVDICHWQGYMLASQPQGLLVSFIREFLLQYLRRYNRPIDYLLLNHVAKVARECLPAISKQYEDIPPNNQLCELLGPELEKGTPSSKDLRSLYLESNTFFYKLSNHVKYPLKSPSGTPTLAADVLSAP